MSQKKTVLTLYWYPPTEIRLLLKLEKEINHHTLETSLWAFLNSDSYKDGVLKAINMEMILILAVQLLEVMWCLLWLFFNT